MMGVEEDVIRAEKLNKVFSIKGKKPLTALNGLSLSVKKGELTAVIGPDGAGKTTLMRLINLSSFVVSPFASLQMKKIPPGFSTR